MIRWRRSSLCDARDVLPGKITGILICGDHSRRKVSGLAVRRSCLLDIFLLLLSIALKASHLDMQCCPLQVNDGTTPCKSDERPQFRSS